MVSAGLFVVFLGKEILHFMNSVDLIPYHLRETFDDRYIEGGTEKSKEQLGTFTSLKLTCTACTNTQTHTRDRSQSQLWLPGRPPYQGSDPGGLGLFFSLPTGTSPSEAEEMAAVGQLFLPGSSLKPQPPSHHERSQDKISGDKKH